MVSVHEGWAVGQDNVIPDSCSHFPHFCIAIHYLGWMIAREAISDHGNLTDYLDKHDTLLNNI